MAVICSAGGNVTVNGTSLHEVTKWSWKATVTSQSYASNFTGGFKVELCGARQGTGTVEGKFDDLNPITAEVIDGELVQNLLLIMEPGVFIYVYWALIKSLDFEVDIDNNAIVSWSFDFASSGKNGTNGYSYIL